MNSSVEPTPLDIHTLQSLSTELVSGRTVLVDADGTEFRFDSPQTRSLFDWYRRNQNKWAGNVQKKDVEELVDQLDKTPPVIPATKTPSTQQQPRVLHLKSIRAHRFAGIHRYGSPENPPEDFTFEFEKPATLIEGMNGAGKTSLLSAIAWCLSGHIYRPQRPPENAEQSIEVDVAEEPDDVADQDASNTITAITPLPSAEVLTSLCGTPLPLDTWVELAFVDESGNEIGSIKRSVQRSSRGKITVTKPDTSVLGLSPLALEVGTRMPGLIPYLQLGKPSDLGQAIAAMTGIKPLQDLARHAQKCQAKLRKDLVKDREVEIADLDADYQKAQAELTRLLSDHPEIAPKQAVPPPSPDRDVERVLASCTEHLERCQADAFMESKEILGGTFDPTDRSARQNLIENVGPALGLLDPGTLSRLISANRLRGLAEVTDEQVSKAEALIAKLQVEAAELARLAEAPDVANRLRLYARVAGWMKSQADVPHIVQDCPVCQSTLEGKTDPVTDDLVRDHLQRFLAADTDYLEKTLGEWQKAAIEALRSGLAAALSAELKQDLPARPIDLIASALGEELFDSPILQGSLNPLQSAVRDLCKRELEALPAFAEPEPLTLPSCFGADEEGVVTTLGRVRRAIAFRRWRKTHGEACATAFRRIIGNRKRDKDDARDEVKMSSLADRLVSLDEMVKQATPLKEALTKLETVTQKLAKRRQKEDRIALYGRAAKAIEPLLGLDALVERQVSFLMNTLSSATKTWKDRLYSHAFVGAPAVGRANVETDGSLTLEAVAGGSKVAAHEISNASDLRATLLAFLFSFWRYLLDTRGGLSLLLLDDLEELFDAPNRRRVANTIPVIVEDGARLVVTSNEHSFGKRVLGAFAEADCVGKLDRRYLHPPNGVRPRIELGVFLESVEEKRQVFEKPDNEDKHQPARDYVNELRIYLEDRLLDLFEVRPARLPEKPTLSDLIGAIRSSRSAGEEPFTSQALGNLVSDPTFIQGSSFIRLMNESHHGHAHKISYAAVKAEAGTGTRICRLVDAAHEAYERWLRRDPLKTVSVLPDPPTTLAFSSRKVSVIENLAAFTSQTGPSELIQSDEAFSTASLDSYAIYVIKTHNLGFAGPAGCRVLVRVSDEPPLDNSLVVALQQDRTFAGRLHRDDAKPEFVVIGSEAENPLKRPPSLFLPANEVRLLQIAGVLFDFRPDYSRSLEQAVLDSDCRSLERIELVFRVDRESALPLAIEGQMILGGAQLLPAQLGDVEGSIVAIATSEGCALKRIGKLIPGAPQVRQFESVGGLGESMLVRTEDLEDNFGGLPLLHSARDVLGVLYELS